MIFMCAIIKKIFSKESYNFLYWLFNKPFGIIAIRSFTFQRGGIIKHFNLGDDLNFYLLRELSGKKVINYNDMRKFKLKIKHYTCIGSIFEGWVDTSSIIWGTGSMYGGTKNIIHPKEVCAVRGPLTRQLLIERGISCPEIYGDPALLLPIVYCPPKTKKYRIGLIPHYIDYDLDNVKSFCEKNGNSICLIPMQDYTNWKSVVDDICSCDFIISSSLHGMILSDAYNVPNVWIQLSDNITGGYFKFHDYFASVGRSEKTPLDFRNKDININDIKEKLKDYQLIHIDLSKLIDSCPFICNKRKRALKNKYRLMHGLATRDV